MLRARIWAARLTLAGRLTGIHKEAWIPAAVTIGGCWATGPRPWALLPINAAAWLIWQWHQAGAYRRNAQDTMLARFHYRWAMAAIHDPENTPQLVAVHLERATRTEARALRRHQGRHTLAARAMTLTIRPRPGQPKQAGPKWAEAWITATRARFGFQTATDPIPAPLDINATQVTFGQERLPTEVRAVVA